MSEKKTDSWKEAVGRRIKSAREQAKTEYKNGKTKCLTQEQLSEKLGVTFQAVSSWERGEFLPDTERLPALGKELNISLGALLADRDPEWTLEPMNSDPDHMHTFVKGRAQMYGMRHTLQVMNKLREAHGDQKRKSKYGPGAPYAVHPLTLACHALAMGIKDDDVIAVCIAHDMLEDGGDRVKPEDLPEGTVRDTVKLLSKNLCDRSKADWEKTYYDNIAENPLACLVKCLDRVNNVSCIADGFSREEIVEYVEETDKYFPKLLDVVKKTPRKEWNNAAWLMRYQLRAVKETIKRIL